MIANGERKKTAARLSTVGKTDMAGA